MDDGHVNREPVYVNQEGDSRVDTKGNKDTFPLIHKAAQFAASEERETIGAIINHETQDATCTEDLDGLLSWLSTKSRCKYKQVYSNFMSWRGNNKSVITEPELVLYFRKLSRYQRATTLGNNYSMLKATIKLKHNIDIKRYKKLTALLERLKSGYKMSGPAKVLPSCRYQNKHDTPKSAACLMLPNAKSNAFHTSEALEDLDVNITTIHKDDRAGDMKENVTTISENEENLVEYEVKIENEGLDFHCWLPSKTKFMLKEESTIDLVDLEEEIECESLDFSFCTSALTEG